MNARREPAVWLPAVRAGTGADVFTERLANGLIKHGIRAEITWLPPHAEYAPWTVPIPTPPVWANVVQINTWLHSRFLPRTLPVVATIHHAVHHADARAYKGIARAAYHRFWIAPNERRVLHRADCVVAVSRFVADTAMQTLVNMPIQVIYNGIDTDRYRPGKRLRRAEEPFRLLYLGSWKKLKGVDLLAPIMRELGNRFELRYTGGKTAEHDKRDWPDNMHDIGRLKSDDAVIAAMHDADALLFPSRSEGFGLVAAEAMACGLPVIAVQASSMPEIVADGATGILCRQDDVVMFANAARTLAYDDALFSKVSQNARSLASQKFSIDAMCTAYEKAYAACVSNRTLVARPA
ncbi:MAG: glycosyltransferase family 4 protein [Gammaproteobacteria bacterium]|nr:glycosyltransferase family 4 protein [Gammaproteobacteria bacterium]